MYFVMKVKKINKKNIFKFGLIVLIVGFVFMNTTAGNYLLKRFLNTGVEIGSATRLNIWSGAYKTFISHPLGVGCGNVIKAINKEFGGSFVESNSHNIYLQFTIDEGIIGLLFISLCLFLNVKYNVKKKFTSRFGFYILLYLFQGLFQSRGVDVWMAVFLGFYYIEKRGLFYEENSNIYG